MKTYVITLSKNFPAYHPRRGEQTKFVLKIIQKEKLHTIRGNYAFWKKRIDEINAGRAVLSVRQWIDKPYFSKQMQVFMFVKGEVGIQKCDVEFYNGQGFITVNDRLVYNPDKILSIISNDGLFVEDFSNWFKKPIIDGCVIHFTDLRY